MGLRAPKGLLECSSWPEIGSKDCERNNRRVVWVPLWPQRSYKSKRTSLSQSGPNGRASMFTQLWQQGHPESTNWWPRKQLGGPGPSILGQKTPDKSTRKQSDRVWDGAHPCKSEQVDPECSPKCVTRGWKETQTKQASPLD